MSIPGVLTLAQLKTDMRLQLPCLDSSHTIGAWDDFDVRQNTWQSFSFTGLTSGSGSVL